jgi:hypothetical protein
VAAALTDVHEAIIGEDSADFLAGQNLYFAHGKILAAKKFNLGTK